MGKRAGKVGRLAGERRVGDMGAGKGSGSKGNKRKPDRAGTAGMRSRFEAPREPGAGDPTASPAEQAGRPGVGPEIPAIAPAPVLASMPELWLASVLVPRESFARLVAQAGELPDALRALGEAETRAAAAEAELRAAQVTLALVERQLERARGGAAPGGPRAEKGLRRWFGRLLGTVHGGSDGVQRPAVDAASGADQLVGGG